MTADVRPVVTCDPGVSFGRVLIRHVPVEDPADLAWVEGVAAAVEDCGLSRGEVLVACWFLAANDRKFQRRWKEWANAVGQLLAAADPDYERIPDPPVKDANARMRWCDARVWPSWAPYSASCGSVVLDDDRCAKHGHEQAAPGLGEATG